MTSNEVLKGDRRELFLDTKGTCFLCLKNLLDTGQDACKSKEVCLRTICKYLGITPSAVLRKCLEETVVSSKDGGDQWDFSVNLCSKCEFLLEELNAVVRQQEIAKILVEHHVTVLNQILRESDEGSLDGQGLWNRSREKMTCEGASTHGEAVEARLLEQLRLETKIKCNSKLQQLRINSFPKVMINRIETTQKETTTHPNPVLSLEEPVLENQNPEEVHDTPVESQVATECCPAPELQSDTHLSMNELFNNGVTKECKQLDNAKGYECQFCKKVVTGLKIHSHMVNLHPEKVFGSAKLPSVSPAKFEKWCKELMTTETRNAAKAVACLFCHELFHNGYYLREHLVLKHYQLLEEKLIQLQKNSELLLELECSVKGNNNSFGKRLIMKRDQCNKSVYSKAALNFHKKHRCPRKQLNSVWICTLAGGGCGRRFTSKPLFHQHQNCNRVKNLTGHKRLKCDVTNCNQTFLFECGLTKHKSHGHRENISRRRKWVCDFASGGCGKVFSQRQSLTRHKLLNKNSEKFWCCGFKNDKTGKRCELVFPSHCSLTRHEKEDEHGSKNRSSGFFNLQIHDTPIMATEEQMPNLNGLRNGHNTEEIWADDGSVTCWCREPYGGRPMIMCDKCLVWYHMTCENVKKHQVPDVFNCSKCNEKLRENMHREIKEEC